MQLLNLCSFDVTLSWKISGPWTALIFTRFLLMQNNQKAEYNISTGFLMITMNLEFGINFGSTDCKRQKLVILCSDFQNTGHSKIKLGVPSTKIESFVSK